MSVLLDMFRRANIEVSERREEEDGQVLLAVEQQGERVGYNKFLAVFLFDRYGKLIGIGGWE